jgi:hypothetical protein
MISFSIAPGADGYLLVLAARRSNSMMGTDRSTFSCRPLLFLLVTLAMPGIARAATLEESAKELSVKIAALLPAAQPVSCEVRNRSSLGAAEVSRIERVVKAEVQGCSAPRLETGGSAATVVVTLSENWKELVWTGEIRRGDAVRAVLLAVPRTGENHFAANSMHVTVRSEKFWEGPERILDAVETSNGAGKSWLVLLLPDSLAVQDLQTGVAGKVEIVSAASRSRDPRGRLAAEPGGSSIWFSIGEQTCKVNLETRGTPECLSPAEMASTASRDFRALADVSPTPVLLPGMGMELTIAPVCGGTNQFLATAARDYTQADSLQVFQLEANGASPMSAELDFPGPILDLHSALDANRAIVRNLATGNYEAYRLDISCGQ